MSYQVIERNKRTYIECARDAAQIASEQDALEWVAICGEHQTGRLLLHAENLAADFFKLRTGLAGDVLQKFATYHIRAAAVLKPELVNQGRFQDMVIEANRGSQFRVFYDLETAAEWLTSA